MENNEKENNAKQRIIVFIRKMTAIRKRQVVLVKEIDEIISDERKKELRDKINK